MQLGGPNWKVKLGRRDSKTASFSDANSGVLPSPAFNLSDLIKSFKVQGLSAKDMVALSGICHLSLSLPSCSTIMRFLFFFSCLYMQMYNEIITTHIIWLMPPNFVWWISMWHLNNWMQRFRSFFLAIGRHFHYKTKKNKWMPFFQFQPILSERITGVLTFLFIDFFTIMYVIFWIRLISYIWKEI